MPDVAARQTGETVHSDDEWFVRRDGVDVPDRVVVGTPRASLPVPASR
jgi:hypothetical protein